MLTIGNNIKTARTKLGLTQEELAFQLGVTSQAVSRWESGTGLPDISMIVPLAQVLSVSTDILFGLNQSNSEELEYMNIQKHLEEVALSSASPLENVFCQSNYLFNYVQKNPSSHVAACCYVESIANLTEGNFVSFEGMEWG